MGGVEAWVDDRPLDLGPVRQRSVLAALLVDVNRSVSVDQLGDRVWGERPPRRFRTTLYSYLSRLRNALSEAGVGIGKEPGGYVMAAETAAIDLHRFRQLVGEARGAADDVRAEELLERALGLWRGDAFGAVDTPWFNALRETLAQERIAAELDRNDAGLRRGRHGELLAGLFTRAGERPLDERLAGQLMLALYRCGRPAEALEHFRRTRHRLVDELGIGPSRPLEQLHQRILEADPALAPPLPLASPGAPESPAPSVSPASLASPEVPASASPASSAHPQPPAPPSAPPRIPVPRQLPAPPPAFTGRARELLRLSEVCDIRAEEGGETVVISAIGGIGGVGKTWLAVRWAHENMARFPDGQLYVNLRGFDAAAEPVPPPVAVRGFLDALGVAPDSIPVDLDAQTALYRSLLAGRRVLVVLDDARDAGQVRPLLPGSPGCTVLVTSRSRLTSLVTTHGALPLPLDVFGPGEARELLVRHLGVGRVEAEPDAVEALLGHCAGLPLALGIVAARAATHPELPLAVLAEELREAATRLDALDTGDLTASLRAVFAASHRALSGPAAELFGLLGLAPGPDIGLSAAASLAGLDGPRTRVLLGELEAAYLVQRHAPARYRMHDLVRLYAAECGRAAEGGPAGESRRGADALRRLVDFYLHTAFAANRLVDGPNTPFRPELDPPAPGCVPDRLEDPSAALGWFEAEHACVLAAQRLALKQERHIAVWQLAWTLISYHWRGAHFRDHVRVWRAGLTAAERQGHPPARALAHWRLGQAASHLGRGAEALDHLGRALAVYEEADDVPGQAHTHRTLGWVWEQQGDKEAALSHACQALRLYEGLGNPVWQAGQLNAVGWCHAQLGRFEEARDHCERALALFRAEAGRGAEASTLDSLGYIAHHTGCHDQALDHYGAALELFREAGNAYDEADTLARIADAQQALGRAEEARENRLLALDLYRAQRRDVKAQHIQARLDASPGPNRLP
ncbi:MULTISPECIES: BTAD domain-containing putative transcriptional regulator [unclassified Streptomyces]|uniref:AfsR/SARP family transcriptional regulator n=1 Tax=unclassified Streptomyces TaxID=2593676 RepID=UPI003369C37F